MDTAVGTIPIFLLYRTWTAYSLTPPRLVRPYIFLLQCARTLPVTRRKAAAGATQ